MAGTDWLPATLALLRLCGLLRWFGSGSIWVWGGFERAGSGIRGGFDFGGGGHVEVPSIALTHLQVPGNTVAAAPGERLRLAAKKRR